VTRKRQTKNDNWTGFASIEIIKPWHMVSSCI
jgi:hypothetical protein